MLKKLPVILMIFIVVSTVLSSGCLGGSNTNSATINQTITVAQPPTNSTTSTTITHTQPTTTTIKNSTDSTTTIKFYMYGIHTCPHCLAMKERITKFYGSDHLVFYDLLERNQTIMSAFKLLSDITHTDGVPQIGIFYNNTLKAVIVGEFGDDTSFKETVNQYTEVVDYYEQQHPNQTAVLMILPSGSLITTNKELIKKLTVIFTDPAKAVQLYGNES